ncbi:MAG: hypothetical protein CMF41_04370 [Legionellales bacterium]|nr:hypothetical protein [Legionellales bacterium]|tara:strand:- start:5391 stop:5966 length:576 start_codon:yes stop_codon:yes gene_type:complete
MNLFLIDMILEQSASGMCDKHVVKMILETAQVLWCAWHLHKPDLTFMEELYNIKPYKKTHINHPISIWIRSHPQHYEYAVRYGLLLCHEYTRRYGKVHKTQAHMELLFWLGYPNIECEVSPPKTKKVTVKATHNIPGDLEYFPMCFAEEYIVRDASGNVLGVESYRNYYQSKQDKFKMVWKTDIPTWFTKI